MNAIKIERHIDSETLHLPELRAMLGKNLEIIVIEKPRVTGKKNLEAFFELAGKIDIDQDAFWALREKSKL
jgi:hypothetical protein